MTDEHESTRAAIDQTSETDAPDDLPDDVSRRTLHYFPLSIVLADPHKDDCPIIYVNRSFVEMTGFAPNVVVGQNCRFLQGEDTAASHRAEIRAALDRREPITTDIVNYRANGERFVNRLMISPMIGDDTGELLYFLGIQTELSSDSGDVERAELLDMRLQELQHRVKNHLSMILSSMRMEARVRPPEEVVGLIARRVETLSVLYHEFAERSGDDDSTVDMGVYLSRVASTIHGLESRPDVLLNIDAAHVQAGIGIAAPTGLLLSEILTNAFQHAFSDREQGTVRVGLSIDGGNVELSVADDGVGIPDGAWPNEDSMGGRITRALIDQIDGKLELRSGDDGTRIDVRFAVD